MITEVTFQHLLFELTLLTLHEGRKEIKQQNNVEFIGVGQINVNFVINLQRTRP